MRISTKGRYGLEAVLDLAIHASEGQVNLKSISERSGISEAYILQIFLILKRAGIVDSIRGAQGGYILAKDPSLISVGDVLIALEGPLAPVACIVKGVKHPCDRYDHCATKLLWEGIMNGVTNLVNGMTIEELAGNYRLSQCPRVPEYYI